MTMTSPVLPDSPAVSIFAQRRAMGLAAARLVQAEVAAVVARQGTCRMIIGCAPSQDDLFAALVEEAQATPEIWRQVTLFHMDDYLGLTASDSRSFRHYAHAHFVDLVELAAFHPLGGEASHPVAEALRYSTLLNAAPIDLICMGIGENGHIAFNDPPVADFNDSETVKIVEMDLACRQQQVNDGCFPSIDAVPRHAFSISLPVFAAAGRLCCVVPTSRKAQAVKDTLTAPIGPACPATLLRAHPRAHLFLDAAAASLLPQSWQTT